MECLFEDIPIVITQHLFAGALTGDKLKNVGAAKMGGLTLPRILAISIGQLRLN